MSRKTVNLFSTFEFSEQEAALAQNLPDLNTQFIQTELAAVATKKVLIPFDPENPLKFQMEHEYYRGQIEILSFLLNMSDAAKEEAIANLQASMEAQQSE